MAMPAEETDVSRSARYPPYPPRVCLSPFSFISQICCLSRFASVPFSAACCPSRLLKLPSSFLSQLSKH
eukprot:94415-Hanusia_phi.AAC.1